MTLFFEQALVHPYESRQQGSMIRGRDVVVSPVVIAVLVVTTGVDGWAPLPSPLLSLDLSGRQCPLHLPPSDSLSISRIPISSRLYGQHPNRQDIQVTFGSELDDDDDVDEGDEEQEHAIRQRQRQATIDQYLAEEDDAYREERRQKLWGDYANATTKEELKEIEAAQKEQIAEDNRRKAELARKQGVQLEVLEPLEGSIDEENGNLNIQIGSGKKSRNFWFEKLDKELQVEWNAMEEGNEKADENNGDAKNAVIDTVQVDGKMVSRDSLAGVRVGSAGGWELEIFPKDFVVHRKYGIGRFERTVLRPKAKLTKEEEAARDSRRAELLREAVKGIPGGATPQQIQEIRSKFGTEEDTDPVSNPQVGTA